MTNPLRDPAAFDYFTLGGVSTLEMGLVDFYDGSSPRKIDVRRGYGLSGATTVFTGIDIKPFRAVLRMWEEAQIDNYQRELVPLLAVPPFGKRPRALSFFYPLLSDPPFNVKAVLINDVSQLEQVADGLWTATITMIAYSPPKPAIAKPITAGDTTPKPADAADQLILDLTKQVQELGKR